MSDSGTPLASIRKRLASTFLDCFAIGGIFGTAYCVPGFPQMNSLEFQTSFALLLFAQQFVSALNPKYSIGRTVFAITVVNAATAQQPSVAQAATRAAARVSLLLAAAAMSSATGTESFIVAALLLEVALMYTSALVKCSADIAANTVVISAPPIQPHRAPAIPMFSREDKEFGNPPRK